MLSLGRGKGSTAQLSQQSLAGCEAWPQRDISLCRLLKDLPVSEGDAESEEQNTYPEGKLMAEVMPMAELPLLF